MKVHWVALVIVLAAGYLAGAKWPALASKVGV
jgi:hypothetical protein